tara:strand:- start:405 stop:692 length:288 start_codon:yes stop_codon:yes gene_type:complete
MSDDIKDKFLEDTKNTTDKELFEGMKTDKAELLQHWMGTEDFFYCHWFAEDAIFAALEQMGMNDVMVTLPTETQRYVSSDSLTGESMVNPADLLK